MHALLLWEGYAYALTAIRKKSLPSQKSGGTMESENGCFL